MRALALALAAGLSFLLQPLPALAAAQPNIVVVFMDNFGWGEPGFNGGGIIRGAATPRLDRLAEEGLRLTNFNLEIQCTPSRSALMTGRYAIRSTLGAADQDTNPVSWSVAASLAGKGLLPSRDRDTAGLGYFNNELQDPNGILASRLEQSVQGVEAYYNIAVVRSVDLALDFQWTKSAFKNVEDAVILGLRLDIRL